MKNTILAFCIVLLSFSADATQIEFNDAESPYYTLERAFNVAVPVESDIFPTTEQAYSKIRNTKFVDRLIDPKISISEFYKIGIVEIVKRIERTVIAAVPARGPLFPGSPETIQLKETFFVCKADCKSDADFIGSAGVMSHNGQETTIQWTGSRKDTFRVYGKSIIGKTINNNQVVYTYGWIE